MSGFTTLATKVGRDRVAQAAEVDAAELYTSCPSCYINLKRAGGKKGVEVRYITALVDDSL